VSLHAGEVIDQRWPDRAFGQTGHSADMACGRVWPISGAAQSTDHRCDAQYPPHPAAM